MLVQRLAESTWEEVARLDGERALAILPVGALEAHGPHLPIHTDVVIATAMAEAGARRLASRGFDPILLPPLTYTAARFGAGFPGTVSIREETVTSVLVDIAAGVGQWNARALILANAHLDPAHLSSLHAARHRAEEEGLLPVIFPDLTQKPWASRLTEEFRSGACHAGQYETSIVLAVDPELVREETRLGLRPNPASLSDAIRAGKRSFEEAGGEDAYFGWPADATAEEGLAILDTLGTIVEDAVLAALRGGDVPGGGEDVPGGGEDVPGGGEDVPGGAEDVAGR